MSDKEFEVVKFGQIFIAPDESGEMMIHMKDFQSAGGNGFDDLRLYGLECVRRALKRGEDLDLPIQKIACIDHDQPG